MTCYGNFESRWLRAAALSMAGAIALAGCGGTSVNPGDNKPTTLKINPAMLDFGTVAVGTTSPPQVVSVKNDGKYNSGPIAVTGALGDFKVASTTCGAILKGGGCTVSIVFAPTSSGVKNLKASITGKMGESVDFTAKGTGSKAFSLAILPASKDFGGVLVGAASSEKGEAFVVSNTGDSAGTISGIATSNDEFGVVPGSDCAGKELAPAGMCTVNVQFRPKAIGLKSGVLTVSSGMVTATSALSGNGQDVGLAFQPASASTATTLVGGMSAAVPLKLGNTGEFPAEASVGVSGDAADFTVTNDCMGKKLAGMVSCTVTVICSPKTPGTRKITLTAVSTKYTATGSVDCQAQAPAKFAVSPGAIPFAPTTIGGSVDATVTVMNTGGVASAKPTATLAMAPAFAVDGGTCGDSLAPGASCTFKVTFKPAAAGAAMGTLTIGGGGTPAPTVALSGTGITASTLTIAAKTKDFGMVVVGQSSGLETFTVTNTGGTTTGDLRATVTGPFALDQNNCTGKLAPMATCTVAAKFSPAAGGAATGILNVSDGASPAAAMLSGTGNQPPGLSVTPSTFNFGSLAVDQASADQSFVVTNGGGTATAALTVAVVGDAGTSGGSQFIIKTNGCNGMTLAPTASCTVVGYFKPTVMGTFEANLAVSAGAATASARLQGAGRPPSQLTVTGNGVFAGVVGVETAAQMLIITNTAQQGTGKLTLATLGVSAADFIIKSTTCTDVGLAPSENCVAQIAYKASAPTAPGATAVGSFTATAAIGGTGQIGLSATAFAVFDLVRISCTTGAPFTAMVDDFGNAIAGSATVDGCFKVTARANVSTFQAAVSAGTPSDFIFGVTGAAIEGLEACAVGPTMDTNKLQLVRATALDGSMTGTTGKSCYLRVTFTPQAKGDRMGTLTANASAGLMASAPLKGVGTGPLQLTPLTHTFTNVAVGGFQEQDFVVTNASLTLNFTSVTAALSNATEFQVVSNPCQAGIMAMSSCTIKVRFIPAEPSTKMVTLTVTATYPNAAMQTVTETATSSITATGVAGSQIVVDPSPVDFGSAAILSPGTKRMVVVRNGATAPTTGGIQITYPASSQFIKGDVNLNTCVVPLSGLPIQLVAGATCTFEMIFIPTSSGLQTGTFNVTAANGPGGTVTANVSGTGTATLVMATAGGNQANQALVDMGGTNIAGNPANAVFPVTLNNFGSDTRNITISLVTPTRVPAVTDDSALFNLQVGTCGGNLLAAGNCTINLQLLGSPNTPTGLKNVRLRASGNVVGGANAGDVRIVELDISGMLTQDAKIVLMGTVPAPLPASQQAGTISFGNVGGGKTTSAQTVTVTNSGGIASGPLSFLGTTTVTGSPGFTSNTDTLTGSSFAIATGAGAQTANPACATGGSLAAGASCDFRIYLATVPLAAATHTLKFQVFASGGAGAVLPPSSAPFVTLTAEDVGLAPGAYIEAPDTFIGESLGNGLNPVSKTVTIRNTSGLPMALSLIAFNDTRFSLTATGTTCVDPVANNTTCLQGIQFLAANAPFFGFVNATATPAGGLPFVITARVKRRATYEWVLPANGADFGKVQVTQTSPARAFRLKNVSEDTAAVPVVTGAANGFSVQVGCAAPVAPGGFCDVNVTFGPLNTPGVATATMLGVLNVDVTAPTTVTLNGETVLPQELVVLVTAPPSGTGANVTLAYGDTPVNAVKRTYVTVQNRMGSYATVTAITSAFTTAGTFAAANSFFRIDMAAEAYVGATATCASALANTGLVAGGPPCVLAVVLQPLSLPDPLLAPPNTQTVATLSGGGPTPVSLTLTASVVAPLYATEAGGVVRYGFNPMTNAVVVGPTPFLAPDVTVGTTGVTAVEIRIRNAASVPTGQLSVSLGGTNAGDFLLMSDGCAGKSLAANNGNFCSLMYQPKPSALGQRDATVTVTGNPGNSVVVGLRTTGL